VNGCGYEDSEIYSFTTVDCLDIPNTFTLIEPLNTVSDLLPNNVYFNWN